jgi:hypothetical protein
LDTPVGRMGGNQKGFSAIGECGVGNLRRTDRRLLTATPLHLKGQKIADYMRRLGFEMTERRCFDWVAACRTHRFPAL